MKRASLLIMAIFGALWSFAQPTITAATNNPVVGDKFFIHYCDTTGVSKGAAGTMVTWNLASLASVFTDSIEYIACAPTPYCDSFPGSTMASTSDGSWYDYYLTDVGQFAANGSHGTSIATYYSDPGAMMKYPMTFGSIAADSSDYVSGGSAYVTTTDSFIADASGTLILPSGTYSNVLRVHVITYERDSFDFGTPSVDTFRSEAYFWYTPGYHSPLLVMFYDTSGSGVAALSGVYYSPYIPPTAVAGDIADRGRGLFVYPNPANEILNIKLNATTATEATISITDIAGRVVAEPLKQKVVAGNNTISYSTASLPPGMYLLRVNTAQENYVEKISIQR